jgi:hypothetical protein
MQYPFFKKENNQLIFTGGLMKVYIPKDYFDDDKRLAKFYGTKVETVGILYFRVFKDEEDTKGGSLYEMKFTQKIFINFNSCESKKGKLHNLLEEDEYYVLTLYNGMVFIDSLSTVMHFTNVEDCTKLFNNAKIPPNFKYGELLNLYLTSMELNATSLRMQCNILEAMIAESCRNKNNFDETFRELLAKKPDTPDIDYKMVSIKDIAMINSTFTAISSEDINRAILTSVNKSRTDGTEKESPVEKTIKY